MESAFPVLLTKWTTPNVKLLISIRRESDKLFHTGVLRKKAIWKRIANKFNDAVEGVFTTGEQCQSKWKKLEKKYKEVKFYNNQSGNNLKVLELYDLMDNVIGNNPNVVPVCTMGSMKDLPQERDTCTNGDEDEISSQLEEEEKEEEGSRKKKRKSRSTSTAVVEFLNDYNTENKTKEKERMDMLKKMHDDKMGVINRFLTLMERQHEA